MRLSAPALLLCIAASSHAAPFELELLVKDGDMLPGFDLPVLRLINAPTINSHGEWAVSVSAGNFHQPGYRSAVLGNDGFRIPHGQLPDGSTPPLGVYYRDVSMNDSGDLAVGISWLGNQLGVAYVNDQVAATSVTGNTLIAEVRLNNAGLLQFADNVPFGQWHGVAQQSGDGPWQQEIVFGRGIPTPIGTVGNDILSIDRLDVSNSGSLIYSAQFESEDDDGSSYFAHTLAIDDTIVAREGDPSPVDGYTYATPGRIVRWSNGGDYAFLTSLDDGDDDPLTSASAIISGSDGVLVSSTQEIPALEIFDEWWINSTGLGFSDNGGILWGVTSDEQISPLVPAFFGSGALMYNNEVVVKTGDILPDGAVVFGFRNWEMSEDGSWAIATLGIIPADGSDYLNAVYRFQIPAPGALSCLVVPGLLGFRRKR